MKANIYKSVREFLSSADPSLIFIVACAVTLVVTVIECVLAKLGKLNRAKIFVHLTFLGGLSFILLSLFLINANLISVTEKSFMLIAFAGLSLLSFIPIKLIGNKILIKGEQIDLARLIDGEYRRSLSKSEPKDNTEPEKLTPSHAEVVKETVKPEEEIDFTHVKNVIERLNYYDLGASDKRVVSELTYNVSLAERGEYTPDLKSKINDGLGSLLKIMSKYGV